MANPTTKAPSGLTIKRDGLRFVFNWKISDTDYANGQQFKYRYRTGKWSAWENVNIATNTVSKAITFPTADYWPNKKKFLFDVEFAVRGRRKPTTSGDVTTTYEWSAWTYKNFALYAPRIPTVEAALDSQNENVCTFSWNVVKSDTDTAPFSGVEWQSILVKESNVTDGSKLKWDSSNAYWQTGTSNSASSSKTITEDTVILSNNSYTRWFRVRSRGAGGHKWSQGGNGTGCSYWRYIKHVYATPNLPVISRVQQEGTLNWLRVNWTSAATAAHPIDSTDVDWAIATPLANRQPPTNPSWNTARSFSDTAGLDAAHFLVDQAIGLDECLWVRVVNWHDKNNRPSVAKLGISGKLTAPSGLSVSTDDTTHRATVTATNNSAVPDSRLAVIFRREGHKDIVVGIIANGSTSAVVQCPNWGSDSISFGVYAFQGSVSAKTSGSNPVVTIYAVNANMKSAEVWDGGSVPVAPTGVTADTTDTAGEVVLTWNWAWKKANRAELSWSKNPNAWESTDEPSTYTITNEHAAKWRVSGLGVGDKWYFAIRLARETSDGITYGPYCDPVMVDLSSEPEIPVLTLSRSVLPKKETLTASWTYNSTDGTKQTYAEICSANVSGETVTYSTIIAHTQTAQNTAVQMPTNWNNGETHWMCVRVRSSSGKTSAWSDPVAVTIAEPITCTIAVSSLESITLDEGTDEERTVTALTEMPLTATIAGAGEGGTTTLMIERWDEFHTIRPDEMVRDGFEGETIAVMRQTGESEITVSNDDLVGTLDDGGEYLLTATTEDGYGQSASAQIRFEVHWSHQAEAPTAAVEIIGTAAKVTATAPASAETGDVCDIYRLSADRPQLVVQGGEFGTAYVDPYPAIGEHGYRVVTRTANGDYIADDSTPAWVDVASVLDLDHGLIDFGGNTLEFLYNAKLSASWSKDFQQTRYLGGSIVGDWNAGVGRTETVNAVIASDEDAVFNLRRLAEYAGVCHVRTQDGSSYPADVQVGENVGYDSAGMVVNVTLTITRVDPERLDGVTYAEWVNAVE